MALENKNLQFQDNDFYHFSRYMVNFFPSHIPTKPVIFPFSKLKSGILVTNLDLFKTVCMMYYNSIHRMLRVLLLLLLHLLLRQEFPPQCKHLLPAFLTAPRQLGHLPPTDHMCLPPVFTMACMLKNHQTSLNESGPVTS